MKRKAPSILIAGIAVIIITSATLAGHKPLCPDDFGTDDAGSAQYLASVDAWTNSFFDSHPDASMTDWAEARHQYWIDNHCIAALQGYEDVKNGKADPATMEQVNKVIQDATGGQ